MLLLLPILVPLATAIVLLLLPHRPALSRAVAFAGAVGLLVGAIALFARVSGEGIQAVQVGGWAAPFGITLVADLFSAVIVVMVGVIGVVLTIVFTLGEE